VAGGWWLVADSGEDLMTYYGGKDLAAAFRTVRENTVKIAEEIPENKYDFRAAPNTRTVGEMLTHIALTTPYFFTQLIVNNVTDMTQVNFQELMQKSGADYAKPRSKADIVALLREKGDEFAALLEKQSDSSLAAPVQQMPGARPASKSRFEMLMSAKEHEMHHRAQLMLIERVIGLVPHLTREREARMAQMQAQAARR
jgi:uncharacterized damage-inducible protein DinB